MMLGVDMFAHFGRYRVSLITALLLGAMVLPGVAKANPEMADSISPYLRLHVDDPVNWRGWDPALLDKAREEQRPLLISSGYYSCYYCHVMQEESFKDEGIAERLNEHFIPVKVDREVDGALDSYLLEFQRATAGSAGWPLNVVVTPDGHALTGVVYAPRDQFAEFLDGITERLDADYDALVDLARRGSEELSTQLREGEEPMSDSRAGRLPQVLWSRFEREADDLGGGFGQSTKFPHSPWLRAMLEADQVGEAPDWIPEFLEITLDEMSGSGLRDVLGGGFFRYSESPDWNEPHFEVMLEDQAQLAWLYLQAGEHYGREDWIELGLENLDFVKRDMALREDDMGEQADTSADGFRGFASSLSAMDDQGREGGAYLWPEEDLATALEGHENPELVRAWFGMEGSSVFDLGYLPRSGDSKAELAERFDLDEDAVKEQIDAGREALIRAREERGLPRDEKVLTGAHGLLLSALAVAADHDERFREAGEAVRGWLLEVADDPAALPALMGLPADQAGAATLNDYAFVAQGLNDWERQQGEGGTEVVAALLENAWERFLDADGFRAEPEPPLPGMISQRFHPAVHRPSPTTLILALTEELAENHETLEAALTDYDLRPGRAIESDPHHHARLILWLQHRTR
ncbi:thioredoxin domain-containing protein [Thioalkalivibrio sp. ALJ7]|uniref:thioredoxin domain-containing protein n=1 Tax=Thioalkalivibrio sp. ALJ7 TaxID=1158756 RepID=UPI00037C031F|nr:DUF255 domain-containing protein [Thioalkalivibrio sp. ALJ7]